MTSLTLILVGLCLGQAYAGQFAAENLFEVRVNSNVRSEPGDGSAISGILYGGFVVAADQNVEGTSWSRLLNSTETGVEGFVSSALLSDPSTSYRVREISNGVHLVKHFKPRSDLASVFPQEHARIYDLSGNFITNLPRVTDVTGSERFDYVRLAGLGSASPYYVISLYDANYEPGPVLQKFLSKDPFGDVAFSVGPEVDFVGYNDEKGRLEFTAIDRQYEYWLYSGASSPLPTVLLELIDGEIRVADDLMITPGPTDEELTLQVASNPVLQGNMSRRELDQPLGHLTQGVLGYMYSGNPEAARALLRRVWPKAMVLTHLDDMTRADFENQLKDLVRTSTYYRPWMLWD